MFLSGENFRFLSFFVILVSGVCLSMYTQFSLIGCAGSVGISLASWVMYIFCVCVSPLCGVPGRYELTWVYCWSRWRHCTDFPFFRRSSGGYGTVELARGGWSVFPLLSSVCCQFSWRLGLCGRNFCVIYFRLVASWYFLAVSYFTSC